MIVLLVVALAANVGILQLDIRMTWAARRFELIGYENSEVRWLFAGGHSATSSIADCVAHRGSCAQRSRVSNTWHITAQHANQLTALTAPSRRFASRAQLKVLSMR